MDEHPRVAPLARRRAAVGFRLARADLGVARPAANGAVLVTPAERASAHNAAELLRNPRDRDAQNDDLDQIASGLRLGRIDVAGATVSMHCAISTATSMLAAAASTRDSASPQSRAELNPSATFSPLANQMSMMVMYVTLRLQRKAGGKRVVPDRLRWWRSKSPNFRR